MNTCEKLKRIISSGYISSRIFNSAIILLYHRVLDKKIDPQLLSVSRKNFRDQVKFLAENYTVLGLSELQKCMDNKNIPKNSVVITFDDGYADNLYNAKPILKEFNTPATVFITGIGAEKGFWWDELEKLLTGNFPVSLDLDINEKHYSWKIKEAENRGYDPEKYRDWNITLEDTPTDRHRIYRELCTILRPLEHSLREKIIDELVSREHEDARDPLSVDEVRSLREGGLIEIGGHTQTHPVLSYLSQADQEKEIMENKKFLESLLDQPVTGFSYPFGSKSDYTAVSVKSVRKAGFTCACSNFAGKVNYRTDPYQLPRFLVRNWNIEEFAQRIEGFFRG